MLKNLTSLILILTFFKVNGQVIKISEARLKDTGTVVTVRGMATHGVEIGQRIRYFQEGNAAISAFYVTGSPFAAVKRGDSIEVNGKLKVFNGLLEIDPINSYTIISSNNPVPEPLSISAAGLVEANESKLVKLTGGTYSGTATSFTGGANFNFIFGATTVQVRINAGSALVGKLVPSPTSLVNITGLCSEFTNATSSTYQLLPRDSADIEFQNIALTTAPTQSNVTTTGFRVNWGTSISGTTQLKYEIGRAHV